MMAFKDTAKILITYREILFMYQEHIVSCEAAKFATMMQNPLEFFTIEYMGKYHRN